MKVNEFVKNFEDVIYKKELIEIESLSIRVKKYIQIEQKVGLANRLFNSMYNGEYFDYVNAKFLVPVMILKEYSEDLEFPENIEDLDATGFYDALCVSGAMDEINDKLGSEIKEINDLLLDIIKIVKEKKESEDPMSKLISDAMAKTPEDIEKMKTQADELMNNPNIKQMLEFKNRSDR